MQMKRALTGRHIGKVEMFAAVPPWRHALITGKTGQNRTARWTSDHGLVARRAQTMKQKPRSRVNRKKAKTVLRLPELEHAKAAVLNSLASAAGVG
jgi:hypothetical protein